MHCDVISMIFAYYSSEISHERSQTMNFCKRSYQPILRYLYTKVKNRRGEISLHKHFKRMIDVTGNYWTVVEALP